MTLAEFKKKFAAEEKKRERASLLADEAETEDPAPGGDLRYATVTTYNEVATARQNRGEKTPLPTDTEGQLVIAHSLLMTAMHHLGFYGDRKLVPDGKITKSDAQIMLNTAEEIQEFLNSLNAAEYINE